MIQPRPYGDDFKVSSLDMNDPAQPIRGQKFSCRTPPVIHPESIIIACVGPTDDDDNSSPDADGWFHSDFYYLHHLFQGTCHKQHWMTSVSPETIVTKYNELVHGDHTSQRVIVLDKDILPSVQDVLAFPATQLSERLLAYIEDISKENSVENRPVVLMMFGHGSEIDFNKYGVHIGGRGAAYAGTTHIITAEQVKKAMFMHNKKAEATVLTVSCYGGGWALASVSDSSTLAGVNEKEGLWSWPLSTSMIRLAGSRYVTGIVETMIGADIVGESEIYPQETPTFATFAKALHDVLVKEIDPMKSEPRFAAKDDKWMQAWNQRSGLPTSNYYERFRMLKFKNPGRVGVGSIAASGGGTISGSTMTMEEFRNTLPDKIEMTEDLSLPVEEATHRLRNLAALYLNSFPGPHSTAKNGSLHRICFALIKNQKVSDDDLQLAARAIHFRLHTIVARANQYKAYLGEALASFPWCNQMDSLEAFDKLEEQSERKNRYRLIWHMITSRGTELFDAPSELDGHPYSRGKMYLALALSSTNWSLDTIQTTVLDSLAQVKRRTSNVDATVRILRDIRNPTLMKLLKEIARECKREYRQDLGSVETSQS